MSRRAKKDDFLRHYTVSDPRTHPKGYTEYKVTAQFISKKDPEDIKEVVVWKRYSDFRKLHGDLAYTHRNLFRRLEEFPAFPRAQVFGRFEASVIEERRKGAEDLLRFTVPIPALNNSPQLKEFFRGGEVTRPSEVSRDLQILPPPLIPTPPSDEARHCQPPPCLSLLPALVTLGAMSPLTGSCDPRSHICVNWVKCEKSRLLSSDLPASLESDLNFWSCLSVLCEWHLGHLSVSSHI
ncbi:sorting nexin 15, isoform CRA_c [Rattus norvegicus]|uniref:Sorting nexin-15 n=1 Tax=Rattus norvegicus TaxID=10116 RepID=A6HZE4_RAT|nr:sorting nexin 15, isoform CRA_c [Rattus norvegicus]